MNNELHKLSGHPNYLESQFPNSPTFDYEFPSEDKFMNFTLRNKEQFNETGQSSTTYNSNPIPSSSSRFQQSQKVPSMNDSTVFRKEKPPKSKEDALFLPYSGSARRSDLSSQRSQGLNSGPIEKPTTKPEAKNKVERSKSNTEGRKFSYEQSLRESKEFGEGRIKLNSSNRTQRDLIGGVDGELEELRKQLKHKERELADNMQLIESLQEMINKGDKRAEISMIQELQAKRRELEEQNEELRQTLRNEIMTSERQRSQYQALESSIDDRLESLGYLTPSPKSGYKGVDLLIEFQNIQLAFRQKEDEMSHLIHRVQALEEENLSLNNLLDENKLESEKMHDDIDSSLKALQSSRDNQRKLEEEKNELVQYYTSQLNNQGKKIDGLAELQAELNKWKEQAVNMDNQYQEVAAELEEKMEEMAKLHGEKVDLLQTSNILKAEKEAVLDALLRMEDEKENLKEEISRLTTELEYNTEDLDKLKSQQHDKEQKLREELEEANKAIKELEESYAQKKSTTDKKMTEERQSYEKKLREQKEMYEGLMVTEKQLGEQRVNDIEEIYERRLKEERELLNEKLAKLTDVYEGKLQESTRTYEAKLCELSETQGQLEVQTTSLVSQTDTLSRLTEENFKLKERLKNIDREQDGKLEQVTKAHEDNVKRYENLVESKNKEISTMALQNLHLKAEIESLHSNLEITQENLQKTTVDLETKCREQEQFKTLTINLETELGDLKTANDFLNRFYNRQEQEIEEYEGKVTNTMTSLKFAERNLHNLETENEVLKAENGELKNNIVSVKQDNSNLKVELKELDDVRRETERKYESLESEIETLRKDRRIIAKEKETIKEEMKGLKGDEDNVRNMVEDLMSMLETFVQDMNRSSIAAQNFLANCTAQLREMIKTFSEKLEAERGSKDLRKSCEYIQSWFIMLLKEIEKDVLQILRMKEDVNQLRRENQSLRERVSRIEEPDRHAMERADDFKAQLKVIREEKFELQARIYALQEREELLDKDQIKLKRENVELTALVNELKDNNLKLRSSIEHLSKESNTSKLVLEDEVHASRALKGHYETIHKEKRSLEDLFNIIIQSVPNQDQAGLLKDLFDLQLEMSRLEKESVTTENDLMENESNLKVSLKLSTKGPNEIIKKRREVERMRQEHQNISTQLGILTKRKTMLIEELKGFEKIEKKRFNQALDIETELLKTREECTELKLKYHDLIEINSTLQTKFKDLTENNILAQNTSHMFKHSLVHNPFEELPPPGRPSAVRANDRTLSRRLSVGNSERPSVKSIISQNQTLTREPLNDRTFKEDKSNLQEIAHSQSFSMTKGASLRDKLSETKNILKSMRKSNKENL